MKINTALERMGDLAGSISERSLSLMNQKQVQPSVDIPFLGNLVGEMVRSSIDAFVDRDCALARKVLASDDEVDSLRDAIFAELIRYMESESSEIRQCLDYMFIARNLERIADHATNIVEDVLFLVEGIDVRHPTSGSA